ncbi:hypothetical protein CANARDRAFT_9893 [[Candida] arabinofermentans NRRL YB-2248]|uniref:CTLH domain-containing protein n=1 Tax=[Candida] arabinofermentans NRRL YB-2248 TaxID=983967 RepID=A0A1E4SUS2_9ASCO|nr:hypothetical protein CANARDRAFT_9893 [[Candida] arabinofermentans NRRL YB-2248]
MDKIINYLKLTPQQQSSKTIDNSKLYYELKTEINLIILNYLIYEGYINSSKSFANELGLSFIFDDDDIDTDTFDDGTDTLDDSFFDCESMFDLNTIDLNIIQTYNKLIKQKTTSSNSDLLSIDKFQKLTIGLKSITKRNEIKLLILNGDIEHCIKLINLNYPTLFEKNQYIYFKLLHQNLIEIIRTQIMNPINEQLFLGNVLKFINLHLSSIKILNNAKFIKELELTMALLCFGNQLNETKNTKLKVPFKLKSLLNLKNRKIVANLVNKSILLNLNNKDIESDDDNDNNDDNNTNLNNYNNVKLHQLIKLLIWSFDCDSDKLKNWFDEFI